VPSHRASQEPPDYAGKAVSQPLALLKTDSVMSKLEQAHGVPAILSRRSSWYNRLGGRSALIFLNTVSARAAAENA
jgi:hypothetical protein